MLHTLYRLANCAHRPEPVVVAYGEPQVAAAISLHEYRKGKSSLYVQLRDTPTLGFTGYREVL